MSPKQEKRREVLKKYSLFEQMKANKKAYRVYLILLLVTIAAAVRSAFVGQWESVFICFLAFLLYFIPPLIEKTTKVQLPTTLQILAFVFVFAAQVLGEIANFYEHVPLWDTLLHTVCGFMFAAFGFCLVDILNRGKINHHDMSPVFLAFVAFCFSMTIGVMWEFIEFGIDSILLKDMQKDFIISNIYSVTFDPDKSNTVFAVEEIVKTVITTNSGEVITIDGYLDIGLIDTMKDLLVNLIGAIVFSIIGFCYVKKRGKGAFASQFIPKFKDTDLKEDEPSDGQATEAPKTE